MTTGWIHQRSLRRVGTTGPPRAPPRTTGVTGLRCVLQRGHAVFLVLLSSMGLHRGPTPWWPTHRRHGGCGRLYRGQGSDSARRSRRHISSRRHRICLCSRPSTSSGISWLWPRTASSPGPPSACEVAQPSVSAQIRRLEDLLGTPLFHRGPGPVTLTDAGATLLPIARRVVADLESIEDEISGFETAPQRARGRRGHPEPERHVATHVLGRVPPPLPGRGHPSVRTGVPPAGGRAPGRAPSTWPWPSPRSSCGAW